MLPKNNTQLVSAIGNTRQLLNVREAAQHLGLEVDTVYKKFLLEEAPCIKLSRPLRRSGEKGGSAVGKTKRGKRAKWMVLVDYGSLPLGVRLASVSPGEVTLAKAALAEVKGPPSQRSSEAEAETRGR
ncbi:hypothetical protein [Granulicella arctica]|uniref:DNA-binding protein n=1 Tax=Granulicella arctica TaxID=940613 RepID=A0A7Y9PHH2_9BACT|nr:hypothetical protein [Granulicella arctica]NYF79844.1 hypothetical protein [Granulicella arctica]